MKPELIALLGALGGVFIGMIGNIAISFITKKYEYNREIKRLVLEISINGWKERNQIAINAGGITLIYPLALDILVNSQLVRLIGKRNINEEEVKKILDKNASMRKLFEDYTSSVKPK